MSNTAPLQPVPIPLVWINLDETPIELASIFQVQVQGPKKSSSTWAKPLLPCSQDRHRRWQFRPLPFRSCHAVRWPALV